MNQLSSNTPYMELQTIEIQQPAAASGKKNTIKSIPHLSIL